MLRSINTFVAVVFVVTGLLFLKADYSIYTSTLRFFVGAKSAKGTVIEMPYITIQRPASNNHRAYNYAEFHPVIQFQDDKGKQVVFKSDTGCDYRFCRLGDSIEVLFDSANPQNAKIKALSSRWAGVIGMTIFASVFLLLGLPRLSLIYKIKWLKKHGQRIVTEVQGINDFEYIFRLSRGYTSTMRDTRYKIVSQWKNPLTGEIHSFESEHLVDNPVRYVTDRNIAVLIDPDNPKKYWMDISFLPK